MGSVFAHTCSAAGSLAAARLTLPDQRVQQGVDGLIFNRNLSELIRNQPGGYRATAPIPSFTGRTTPGPTLCPRTIFTLARSSQRARTRLGVTGTPGGASAARWKPSGYRKPQLLFLNCCCSFSVVQILVAGVPSTAAHAPDPDYIQTWLAACLLAHWTLTYRRAFILPLMRKRKENCITSP